MLIDAARKGAMAAGQFSPLNTVLLTVAIGILGMILNFQIKSRQTKISEDESAHKLKAAEANGERAGLHELIRTLQGQIKIMGDQMTAQQGRIDTLEAERDQDHRLIIELMGHMNRTQGVAILGSNNLSPAMRRSLEGRFAEEPGE